MGKCGSPGFANQIMTGLCIPAHGTPYIADNLRVTRDSAVISLANASEITGGNNFEQITHVEEHAV